MYRSRSCRTRPGPGSYYAPRPARAERKARRPADRFCPRTVFDRELTGPYVYDSVVEQPRGLPFPPPKYDPDTTRWLKSTLPISWPTHGGYIEITTHDDMACVRPAWSPGGSPRRILASTTSRLSTCRRTNWRPRPRRSAPCDVCRGGSRPNVLTLLITMKSRSFQGHAERIIELARPPARRARPGRKTPGTSPRRIAGRSSRSPSCSPGPRETLVEPKTPPASGSFGPLSKLDRVADVSAPPRELTPSDDDNEELGPAARFHPREDRRRRMYPDPDRALLLIPSALMAEWGEPGNAHERTTPFARATVYVAVDSGSAELFQSWRQGRAAFGPGMDRGTRSRSQLRLVQRRPERQTGELSEDDERMTRM